MNQTHLTAIKYWLPVGLLCAAIFVQSSYPAPPVGPDFPFKDKVLHALVYGLLAALCARACRHTWPDRLTHLHLLVIGVGFGTLYGISDEWHQGVVAARHAEGMDVVADLAGSILGAALYIRGYHRPDPTDDRGST